MSQVRASNQIRNSNAVVVEDDGSISFSSNQSMGGNSLTNVAEPTSSQDLATRNFVDNFVSGATDSKDAVKAATTSNIADLTDGPDTIDGYSLQDGDRVLVWQQSTASENGLREVSVTGGGGLNSETINTGGNEIAKVAIDTQDNLHAAWRDSNSDFQYSKRSNGTWSTPETVTAPGFSRFDLEVDNNDIPHLFEENNGLEHHDRIGNSWSNNTITSENIASSLGDAHDHNNGFIYIAYYNGTDVVLQIYDVSTDSWNTGNVVATPSGDVPSGLDIETDSVGDLNIAWYDDGPEEIKWTRRTQIDGTYLAIETVSSTNLTSLGNHVSLGVDSNDIPHIAHEKEFASDGEDLAYNNRTNDAWNNEKEVDSNLDVRSSQLVVDSAGTVHLFYTDINDNLYYVKREDGSFGTITTVDSPVHAGSGNMFGLLYDSKDRISAVYINTNSTDIIRVYAGTTVDLSTRTTDADEDGELQGGTMVFIEQGNTYSNMGFIITSNDPISIGTDPIEWSVFTGTGQFTAGDGLTKTPKEFNVNAADASMTINSDDLGVNVDQNSATVAIGGSGLQIADGDSGYIIIGQGSGSGSLFKQVGGDATLAADGTLSMLSAGSVIEFTGSGIRLSQVSAGQLIVSQGSSSDSTYQTISGDVAMDSTGTFTIQTPNATVDSTGSGVKVGDSTSAEILIAQGAGNDTTFNAITGDISLAATGEVTIGISGSVLETTSSGVRLGQSTAGNIIIAQGTTADSLYQTVGGDATLASDGTLTLDSTVVFEGDYIIREAFTGDGSTTTFTLANTPVTGTEHVHVNGILMHEANPDDYNISGSDITFTTAPKSGDPIRVNYLI